MSLVYKNGPDEAVEAVKNGLELMASKGALSTPRLSNTLANRTGAPLLEEALPVYHLGLSDLAESPDIKASIQTGWRYPIRQNGEILAHAETDIDQSKKHFFAGIHEGPFAEGVTEALKAAEEQSEIKAGNFEVRLLFIPALHVAALWLVDKKDNSNFAVPIEPTPASLIPNKLILLEDLLTILQDKAKSALAFYQNGDTRVG